MLQLATKADWPEIKRLSVQIHDLHAAWRPDIYYSTQEPYAEDAFERNILDRLVYVAKLEQTVVGFVVLLILHKEGPGIHGRKNLRVDSICVDETVRGHGIGMAMMEDVRALAKAFGCDGILLSVHPENDRAVAFYQKCGFTIRTLSLEMNF